MSGNNPPSAAATARALEATQSQKRSVQASFDGERHTLSLTFSDVLDFPSPYICMKGLLGGPVDVLNLSAWPHIPKRICTAQLPLQPF